MTHLINFVDRLQEDYPQLNEKEYLLLLPGKD